MNNPDLHVTYGIRYYIDDQVVYETVSIPSLISKSEWMSFTRAGKERFILGKLRFQRGVPQNVKLTPFLSEVDYWEQHYCL